MIGSKGGGVSNQLMTQIPHLIQFETFAIVWILLVIEDSFNGFPAYIIQFIRKVGNFLNSGPSILRNSKFQKAKNAWKSYSTKMKVDESIRMHRKIIKALGWFRILFHRNTRQDLSLWVFWPWIQSVCFFIKHSCILFDKQY